MNSKRFAILSSSVALLVIIIAVVAFARFTRTAPKRCRVLFGPTAATKVTMEVDGDRLLISRGTDPRPQQFEFIGGVLPDGTTIDIRDASSNARYTITSVSRYQVGGAASGDALMIAVTVEDDQTRFEQYCDVELREASKPPAIAHFDGPLTVSLQTINWQIPKATRFVRGAKPTDIRAMIGTIDGDRGCWTVVRTHQGEKSTFPDGVFPYVEIEFPPKSPGSPLPKERFALDKFC